MDISYQFQNTLSKEGDFPTIDFLHLSVYKGNVKIGIRFFGTYRDYKFKSAGVLGMEVLLAVSYQDKQIYEPSMKPDVFTEEIVKDMEEQAKMFEKVLDIVKEECQK